VCRCRWRLKCCRLKCATAVSPAPAEAGKICGETGTVTTVVYEKRIVIYEREWQADFQLANKTKCLYLMRDQLIRAQHPCSFCTYRLRYLRILGKE
jgi:hypothetical protein